MNKVVLGVVALSITLPLLTSARSEPHIELTSGSGSIHSGSTWTGSTASGHTDHPHNGSGSGNTQSGSLSENEGKGLMLAMGKLSPTDRAALIKIIHDYLVSKGITVPTGNITPERKTEIKEIKKDTREEVKTLRKKNQEELKNKREEARAKIRAIRTSTASGSVNR